MNATNFLSKMKRCFCLDDTFIYQNQIIEAQCGFEAELDGHYNGHVEKADQYEINCF